jgi:phosphohistidine phosphatase
VKTLGLLRHAKSDQDDPGLRDFDRGVSARGLRGAALMGQHIREHGLTWNLLLASPAERVKRTLKASGLNVPVQWEKSAYLADAETLMGLLRRVGSVPEAVLLAAHNPGLQDLIFALSAEDAEGDLMTEAAEKYPTATFAVLELDITGWADLAPGCGRLVHFARPRDLDPELGPEA